MLGNEFLAEVGDPTDISMESKHDRFAWWQILVAPQQALSMIISMGCNHCCTVSYLLYSKWCPQRHTDLSNEIHDQQPEIMRSCLPVLLLSWVSYLATSFGKTLYSRITVYVNEQCWNSSYPAWIQSITGGVSKQHLASQHQLEPKNLFSKWSRGWMSICQLCCFSRCYTLVLCAVYP